MGDSGNGGRNGRGQDTGGFVGPPAPGIGRGLAGPPAPSIGRGLAGPPAPGRGGDPTAPNGGFSVRDVPHLTDPGEYAGLIAKKQAAYAQREAQFIGPRQPGFFERLGQTIGGLFGVGEEETTIGDLGPLEADRPTEERALQRSIFAEAAAVPETFEALQQRAAARGTGFVTGEEAAQLGGLARTAAQARAAGATVDVKARTVSVPTTGFLGIETDITKALGRTFLGEDYTVGLQTFAGQTRAQQRALASQLEKGTIAAAPETERGYDPSVVGRFGEFFGFGRAAKSFTEAAASVPALGVVGAVPAVTATYGLVSAFQALQELAEEDVTLGIAPSRPTRAPARDQDEAGGQGAFLGRPVQAPRAAPRVETELRFTPPPRRRPARGAGLESTIRTGFFGAGIPTVRRVR